jgi:hypothetical protein
LGLNVLSDDLKASSNPQDKERYETIEDIAASCQVALSILVSKQTTLAHASPLSHPVCVFFIRPE